MLEATNKLKYIPFENFKIGQTQNFGAYEVTEEEIKEFASKFWIRFPQKVVQTLAWLLVKSL